MTRASAGAATARPARALMVGGALPGAVAAVVVSLICGAFSGRAAGSALIGSLLSLAAFAVGPALLSMSRTLSPPAVMAVAMAGYLITVMVLAIAYAALGAVGWISGQHVALGILVTAAAWLGGQMRAAARLRILAYGSGTEGDGTPGHAVESGSPASPENPLH
jgi:ATP synthase protein I